MRTSHSFLLAALFILLFSIGAFHARPQLPAGSTVTANGYGGPIAMAMATSAEGKITGIRILGHHETSSYFNGVHAFLAQFIGKTSRDPLLLGKDIDAISGATISSEAITSAVRQSLHKTPAAPGRIHLRPVIISLILLAIAATAFIIRHNALRWAVLFGGFVYFGLIAHTMLSIVQVAQAGLGHIPSPAENALWWMTLILGLGATLVIGRIYCGSLCPFALIQEILHQMMLRKRPAPAAITPLADRNARLIKYILLFGITGICFLTNSAAAANVEPFLTLFSGHGSKLTWAFLMFMLVMAVFDFRFWCKYLCPVGALTSLAAVFSIFRIKPTAKCTACGTCTKVCPTKAITPDARNIPQIDPAECIACARCLRFCPEKALTLGPCHDKKI